MTLYWYRRLTDFRQGWHKLTRLCARMKLWQLQLSVSYHSTWPNSINPGQIPLENGILFVAPFLLGPQVRKVQVSHSFFLPVSYVSDAHTWKARKKRQVSLCLIGSYKYALHKIWKIVLRIETIVNLMIELWNRITNTLTCKIRPREVCLSYWEY